MSLPDPSSTPPSRGTPARRVQWLPLAISAALVASWVGIFFIYHIEIAGFAVLIASTAVLLAARRRAQELADHERSVLAGALDAATARTRELESFRHLSQVLLSGRPLSELFHEIARLAGELLDGEAAAVGLVTEEEGRFLRMVAGTGLMAHATGRLIPVDRSLAGWVVSNDRPLISDDMRTDPRTFEFPDTPSTLVTAVIAPLRSSGLVIGIVTVMNRRGGHPFREDDLELLQALGDQAALGLDRANVFEENQRNALALAEKNRELREATQLKDEFLANVSHELRTPLNSIIGFSDLMLTGDVGPVAETHREFIESIHRNGKHLLRLINSVLDVSRVDAGRMALELSTTDLRDAIRAAVTDTEGLRLARHQAHRFELPDTPLMALADAVRVQQILFNLLANASKFTPEGGEIVLRALATEAPLPVPAERGSEHPRHLTRAAVWIAVSDNGIGIEPTDMNKLFVEFSQVDSSASRRVQGSGLGLALCKRFVELHGGQIGAESIFGRGSTFWFMLPAEGPLRRSGAPIDQA